MKRFYFLILSVLLMGGTDVKADNVPDGMEIDAQTWCKSIVAGWNLGNSLECNKGSWDNTNWTYGVTGDVSWETAWSNPVTTQTMIDKVKAAGFNAIRIPVNWYGHVTDYNNMTIDPAWLKRVREVVDYCINDDLYVIINTHHEDWFDNNPYYSYQTKINTMLGKLWTNIATYFADYDGRLAFAGTNETYVSWSDPSDEVAAVQHSYQQTFIDAVRATGGKNLYRNLIVQTYACNHDYGVNRFTMPTDKVEKRLSVEIHYYQPWSYCGDCSYVYWGTEYSKYGSIPYENEATIKNLFNSLQQKWWDNGYGVVIGEYGVTDHTSGSNTTIQKENQTYYLKTLVSLMREHGYAGFVWDNNAFGNGSEKYGIFNRNNNMHVDNEYALKGIIEGSGQEYNPSTSTEDSSVPAYDGDGTVLWEGNSPLNWGSGLQLKLDKSYFASLPENSHIALYFSVTHTGGTPEIQFFDGNWSGLKLTCDGTIAANYKPVDGQTSATFDIPSSTLSTLKSSGLIIQGTGANLIRVVLLPNAVTTGVEAIENGVNGNVCYNLQGQRLSGVPTKSMYIMNGKTYIAK